MSKWQRVPANGPNDRINLAMVKYPTLTQVDHEAADIRTTRRQVRKSLKLRQQPIGPRASTGGVSFILRGFCSDSLSESNSRRLDLIPRSCEHLSFDCLASPPHYAGHRSLMDSSLDVTIAKKQIGPDVEAAIGDTSWPMWSLVPGEDSSSGNVMGGRKLARYVLEAVVYVLEAVVGRCAGWSNTACHFSARQRRCDR